jgi:hypothetical protein
MRDSPRFRQPSQNRSQRGYFAVLLLVVAATAASCGRSDRLLLYPVEGTVRCQGRPAVGALVVFHPQDPSEKIQKLRPAANVDAEGRYCLSTYQPRDGAPPGEYRVTVVWPSPGSGERPGPDRLGGRYAKPAQTPLAASVREGSNMLEPFDLQPR